MWLGSKVFVDDLENINKSDYIPWEKLDGKTVLITGATGLIGYYVVSALLYRNVKYAADIRVLAFVRNIEKACRMFAEQMKDGSAAKLEFLVGEIDQPVEYGSPIDYIIHGASPTASRYFAENPVETINTVVNGTMNMLRVAMDKQLAGFVYMSSMEVYGAPHTDDNIIEKYPTNIDTMSVRSCYPEAKRMSECLCASVNSEYGIRAMVVRLAQTFGPGVHHNDGRVFAEFARCAMGGRDIVLQTTGTSKRCYLYVADAVTAVLTILLKGEAGNAYNAANADTYCSIVEMADMVTKEISKDGIQVTFKQNTEKENKKKFPPPHHLKLDSCKLKRLGWKAGVGLKDMYLRMIECME